MNECYKQAIIEFSQINNNIVIWVLNVNVETIADIVQYYNLSFKVQEILYNKYVQEIMI